MLQLEKSLCASTDPAWACRGYSLGALRGLLIGVASLVVGHGLLSAQRKACAPMKSQHSQKINKQIKIPKIKKRNLEEGNAKPKRMN